MGLAIQRSGVFGLHGGFGIYGPRDVQGEGLEECKARPQTPGLRASDVGFRMPVADKICRL